MQSLLLSPHMRDNLGALANPELCSLTLWGQLCLLREDAESASGSQVRCVGTLIDGWDAYQPQCVTDT